MTSNEIRASFLDYFEQNGHRVVPSSPLVPGDDPTLLFTNAGMNQFKDVFLGREKRDYTRATTAQKVMRVSGKHNDLDNVGPSLRHHTFFEMLGNFSFGDYFKKDAIALRVDSCSPTSGRCRPDRLVVSIFKGEGGIPRDDEAYDDLAIARRAGSTAFVELGADDNFWQMGDTGPCGRCSEIYFVRGGTGADPEIEIWNNVFMEFERSADGTLTPLPAPSHRHRDGSRAHYRRCCRASTSNYDTDLFTPLLTRNRASSSGGSYGGTVSDPQRHLDARRGGSHAIDDVPHRRRRDSVERVARLRAAQDHAARDASREAPRLHRTVHARTRRRARPRDGRRVSGSPAQPRDDREDDPRGGEPLRRRADARASHGSKPQITKAHRQRPREPLPGDVAFQTVRHLRSAVRLHRGHGGHARRSRSIKAGLRPRRWRRSAQRARVDSPFGGEKGEDFELPTDAPRCKQVGDRFEGYATTAWSTVRRWWRCSTKRRPPVEAWARTRRVTWRSAGRRSTSRPAARCRTPAG